MLGRNVMHGLYRPHDPERGASRHGPSGWVTCDTLMAQQLRSWNGRLSRVGGGHAAHALVGADIGPDAPSLRLAVCGDACFGDDDDPGMGGFCHGHFWYFPVPAEDAELLNTPIFEFLAAAFNIIVFAHELEPLIREAPDGTYRPPDRRTDDRTIPPGRDTA